MSVRVLLICVSMLTLLFSFQDLWKIMQKFWCRLWEGKIELSLGDKYFCWRAGYGPQPAICLSLLCGPENTETCGKPHGLFWHVLPKSKFHRTEWGAVSTSPQYIHGADMTVLSMLSPKAWQENQINVFLKMRKLFLLSRSGVGLDCMLLWHEFYWPIQFVTFSLSI